MSNPDETRTELANALLALAADYQPIFDAADGMRADLERRGWSPTAAESVALTWLTNAIQRSWQST